MSQSSEKLNPLLLNQTKFLSGTSVTKSSDGFRIIELDSLFRTFEDGPANKKNRNKYTLKVSADEMTDPDIAKYADLLVSDYSKLRDAVDEYNMLIVKLNNLSAVIDGLAGNSDRFSNTLNRQSGTMYRNFNALSYSMLRAADLKRRKVVLDRISQIRNPPEMVVDRITPKRIFVRSIGGTVNSQYNWDGSSTFGSSINIAETFPEGVQEFYSKQQKALKS